MRYGILTLTDGVRVVGIFVGTGTGFATTGVNLESSSRSYCVNKAHYQLTYETYVSTKK